MLNIGYETLDIVLTLLLRVQWPMSDVHRPISGIQVPMSDVPMRYFRPSTVVELIRSI